MMKNEPNTKGLGLCFLCIITVFAVLQWILPSLRFSQIENRLLQQKPVFSFTSFLAGTYQNHFTSYKNDQFPFRSRWVQKKTDVDLIFGIRKLQDVYIGKDDTLFQDMPMVSEEKITTLSTVINQFYTNHTQFNIAMMLVPNHLAIQPKLLPKSALIYDQEAIMTSFLEQLDEKIKRVPVLDALKAYKGNDLFYKTDHHWTTIGAKTALDPYLTTLGIENKNIAYDTYISTDHFYGTLANKTGYYRQPDTIQLYLPKDDTTQAIVHVPDEDYDSPSLYDVDRQFDNNAYEIFLGGNHPRIDISTTANTNRKLLILKDSYANCFLPFLIPYYQQIIVIDPRYYYDDLQTIINENGIQDIVFLYNTNTFFSNNALEQILS